MSERRSNDRCPYCQGPAVENTKFPDGIKCRRSTCVHNHCEDVCPRCSKSDIDQVNYQDGKFELTCKECAKVWTKSNSST